jgi:hypothetical protein
MHMPIDTAELEGMEHVYSLLGLLGCVGSMDGVHFAWDNCPSTSVPAYKGKDTFPTVVYNVTCDHARHVMCVHGPFPCARNDKNLTRTDQIVRAVRYNMAGYYIMWLVRLTMRTCTYREVMIVQYGNITFANLQW